jgi:hypothetical protein
MLKLQNSAIVSKEIEKLVNEKKFSYLEAIMYYMQLNNIDYDVVPKLINKTIKDRLKSEATDLNLLGRKPSKLEFLE